MFIHAPFTYENSYVRFIVFLNDITVTETNLYLVNLRFSFARPLTFTSYPVSFLLVCSNGLSRVPGDVTS